MNGIVYMSLIFLPAKVILLEPELKDNRAYTVERNKYISSDGTCKYDVTIKGSGFDEDMTVNCQLVDSWQDPIYTDKGFVVGDYRKDRLCIFSDTAGSLVFIAGKRKICYVRNLGDDKVTSDGVDQAACEAIKNKIVAIWNKNNKAEDLNFYQPTDVVSVS